MDLRQLLTLRTVVDKGSFSQAAEELEVSQPAVSFQIRALEERLGHRLLDRSGRRVPLTEAGEVVYRYARRMIGLEAELEREMGEIGTPGRRAGWCSAPPPGPARCCCRGCSGAFHAAHPDVRVSLVVSDTQTVCERVLDDELELGVVGAARPQRGLVFEPFVRDELVAIVPPGHPLAERGSVTPGGARGRADAAAAGGLGRALGGGGRDARGAACATATCTWRWSSGLQQSVKAAVLDGFGITVISRLAVEREVAEGSLVALRLEGPGLERHFFAVRHAGRTPKRVTTAFVEFARAELGDMAAARSSS